MDAKQFQLFDTTLRDGSYAIDFKFTEEDTAQIAKGLETAGIQWIEVGHGLGMGASRAGRGNAAASDEAYLHAAAESLSTAKFGPFFIPGIGEKEDIDRAVNCGAHFIRIGTNPNLHEVQSGFPFIEYAKERGLMVFMNLMKSYMVPPSTFAENVTACAKAGADCVYLMDSAGGMQPHEVKQYLEMAIEACDSPIGFHGHDNLSLAVANSLQAVDTGVQFVDATLQGLGRSAGNAVMEALVSVLQLRGQCTSIQSDMLIQIGKDWITQHPKTQSNEALNILSGRAKVHSALIPTIIEIAQQANISAEALLLKLSDTGTLNHSQEHLEMLAQTIQDESA